MDRSLFVLLLLSGLFWSSSALSRQYHYINVRMSWPEAQSYCRTKYTDLATVDTMDDVNRLVNIVDSGYSGSVWIGLKRGTQKHWAWSNGENTLTQFSAWDKKEPISHNECGSFSSGVWYSYPCSSNLHYVCYSESEYIRVQIDKNWSDAQSYCRQHHTDLITIHNSEEQNTIKSIIPSGSWVWIGLFQDSWEWSDKWSRFFRNWAAGQPSQSSGSGDCVSMSTIDSGKWAHESCDLKHPFICHEGSSALSRQYHYINVRMSWPEAQSYCRTKYTDLATVDTMDDVNRLVNIVDSGYSGSVWIGLKRGTQKHWAWSNGENTLTQFSAWDKKEPISHNECGSFSSGVWYSYPCSSNLHYVCYSGEF
ncbi:hypothetical protein PO909_031466 [Leuciscus waleckii]